MAEALARGSRISGAERAELTTRLAARYAAGESIRAIAEDTGRSFGFVHGLVKESGVPMRSRGGATRGRAARAVAATTPESAVAADASTGEGGPPEAPKSSKSTTAARAKDGAKAAKGKSKDKGKDKKSGKKGKR